MQNTARRPKVLVFGDGTGIVSHAGGLLVTETARVTGLQAGLSGGLGRWRPSRAVHDPGKIALALGGDCQADVAVLIRADSGGGTREFLNWLAQAGPAAGLLGRVHHDR
jgi:hypothetical protein